jgi:hypothetical protein
MLNPASQTGHGGIIVGNGCHGLVKRTTAEEQLREAFIGSMKRQDLGHILRGGRRRRHPGKIVRNEIILTRDMLPLEIIWEETWSHLVSPHEPQQRAVIGQNCHRPAKGVKMAASQGEDNCQELLLDGRVSSLSTS